jgi:hypothetical protein
MRCYCTKCLGRKRTWKTIQRHTDVDIRLRDCSGPNATPQFLDYMDGCIANNMRTLQGLAGMHKSLHSLYLIGFAENAETSEDEDQGEL